MVVTVLTVGLLVVAAVATLALCTVAVMAGRCAAYRQGLAAAAQQAEGREATIQAYAQENENLRGLVAQGHGPCIYCGLAADQWARCCRGFPGCGRADDACKQFRHPLLATPAWVPRVAELLYPGRSVDVAWDAADPEDICNAVLQVARLQHTDALTVLEDLERWYMACPEDGENPDWYRDPPQGPQLADIVKRAQWVRAAAWGNSGTDVGDEEEHF